MQGIGINITEYLPKHFKHYLLFRGKNRPILLQENGCYYFLLFYTPCSIQLEDYITVVDFPFLDILGGICSGRYEGDNALVTRKHTGNDPCGIFLSNGEIWGVMDWLAAELWTCKTKKVGFCGVSYKYIENDRAFHRLICSRRTTKVLIFLMATQVFCKNRLYSNLLMRQLWKRQPTLSYFLDICQPVILFSQLLIMGQIAYTHF